MLFDDPNLLSNEEIRAHLEEDGYSSDLIESIIQQFWMHDWGNSFIAIKEHFSFLQRFLAKENSETFSRFDFYSYFTTFYSFFLF